WFLIRLNRVSTSASVTLTPSRLASWLTSVRLIIASRVVLPWEASSRCTSASCEIGSPFTVASTVPPAAGAATAAGIPPMAARERSRPLFQRKWLFMRYSLRRTATLLSGFQKRFDGGAVRQGRLRADASHGECGGGGREGERRREISPLAEGTGQRAGERGARPRRRDGLRVPARHAEP